MPHDKSPPKSGLILKGAVLAIATLLVVHAALVTYFDHIAQAEEHRKFGETKPEALINLRADEKDRLNTGRVPIDKAMQELIVRGRTASPDITPTESKDIAPLQGWPKLPSEVPPAMTAPQPPPPPAGVSASASASAPSAQPVLNAGGNAAAAPPASAPAPKPKTGPGAPRGPTPSKPSPKNP